MRKLQLAHASLSIAGDEVDPPVWTAYFNVAPDVARRKCESRVTPHGQFANRTGVWSIQSKRAVESDALEPHLRYLIERLQLPRSDLRGLLESQNARMRFFCFWRNSTGKRVPDIPADISTMMQAMGGVIEIDEYS